MPRYFFDLKDGSTLRDPGGLHFASDHLAVGYAETMAREIAATHARYASAPQLFVHVICEGKEVAKILIGNILLSAP